MSFVKREYSPGQTTITSENLNDIQDELIRLEQDKYVKPDAGIPKTDLADAVKTSLGKADSALQSVPDTYRTASDQDAIDAAQDTEISDLESALEQFNSVNYLNVSDASRVSNGVTWSIIGGNCTFSGTSTGTSFILLLSSTSALPDWMEPGETYQVRCYTTDANVKLGFIFYKNGSSISNKGFTDDGFFEVPDDADGVVIRYYVNGGNTVSGYITAKILNAKTNEQLTKDIAELQPSGLIKNIGVVPNNSDMNDLISPAYGVLTSGYTYYNTPPQLEGHGAFIMVLPANQNVIIQVVIDTAHDAIYARSAVSGLFSTRWDSIRDVDFASIYLASPGDGSDMTGAIHTMLDTTGVCNLGPGDFYVTGIDIPENATLRGSGTRTKIILSDSVTSGYAVKLQTQSCVKDLQICGVSDGSYTPSETIGTRNGILWEGTADAESGAIVYRRSTIENVTISGFSGSGIKCYNTGPKIYANLHVCDVFIYFCDAGVNIAYYSEFHRFTNISVTSCYYGCIVNGGNCYFTNCNISASHVNLLMDNSNDTMPNNSHGVFSACVFAHAAPDNTGTNIKLIGQEYGEIFSGCTVGYGSVEIQNCTGIRFVGVHFGRSTPIEINDSTVVTFSEGLFNPTGSGVTGSGNTTVTFTNCYKRDGSAYNVPTWDPRTLGNEEDAIYHLGFYLDENGDLCQVEEETNNG